MLLSIFVYILLLLLLIIVSSNNNDNKISRRLYNNDNNNNNITRNIDEEIDNNKKVYDFIFGFSTGHAGTTTLSLKDYYQKPNNNILFLHELKFGPSSYPYKPEFGYRTETWQQGNPAKDYAYVKDILFPFLLRSQEIAGTSVVMDLGHHNLYFIDALIKYMKTETQYKYIMVRIRRERLEQAVSLTFHNPKFPIKDICKELVTRYCPYDREDEVILKPPSKEIWTDLNTVQQAFWIMDETEARWNRLKNENPDMDYLELYWSKSLYGQSSMDSAALKVAKLLNLEGITVFNETWEHVKNHIHSGSNLFTMGPDKKPLTFDGVKKLDLEYQRMMRYQYIPG